MIHLRSWIQQNHHETCKAMLGRWVVLPNLKQYIHTAIQKYRVFRDSSILNDFLKRFGDGWFLKENIPKWFMPDPSAWMTIQFGMETLLLLMAEILHQLIGSLSHYLQGFIHPRWWLSAINSSKFYLHSTIWSIHWVLPKYWGKPSGWFIHEGWWLVSHWVHQGFGKPPT